MTEFLTHRIRTSAGAEMSLGFYMVAAWLGWGTVAALMGAAVALVPGAVVSFAIYTLWCCWVYAHWIIQWKRERRVG